MSLLAIDPGKITGWALFEDSSLCDCGISKTHPPTRVFSKINVIIEKPKVYPNRPIDSNDLIELAIRVGRIVEYYSMHGCTVSLVRPSDWKGQLPKDVLWERARARLSEKERAVEAAATAAPSYRHNMRDAIGIGLWKLGRL